jgi:hypothetical protein
MRRSPRARNENKPWTVGAGPAILSVGQKVTMETSPVKVPTPQSAREKAGLIFLGVLSSANILLSLCFFLFTRIDRLICVSLLTSGIVILALVCTGWRVESKKK